MQQEDHDDLEIMSRQGQEGERRRWSRWGMVTGVLWALSLLVLYGVVTLGSAPDLFSPSSDILPNIPPAMAARQQREPLELSEQEEARQLSPERLEWVPGGRGPLHDNRTLVVYVYFEKNQLYKDNLKFFLELGVQQRDDVDFVFVLQGACTVSFPVFRNVRVYQKENDCLDFGGWRYGLDKVGWRQGGYKYFVFMNSSVRGPYLPLYVPSEIHWTTLFAQLLRASGDSHNNNNANGPIKLAGMTINCHLNRPHVQSMLWVTDSEGLEYLIDKTEVVTCKSTMMDAIKFGEIALSAKMLANGWNIGSLAVAYRGWDFRVQRTCNANQDPNYENSYFGIAPGVHETIFVKTNRQFRAKEVKVYSRIAWQQHRQGQFDGRRFNVARTPL